ncbi:MAG TPA: hypothetical protein VM733_01700 [Thermoanaerobaculia bacterium]|nr:hypothetical protein [Thermoanaerobaculia bacterium]
MSDPKFIEESGATEEQNQKIDAIVGNEALGYEGSGRPEHSGQQVERERGDLGDDLADNRPEQTR